MLSIDFLGIRATAATIEELNELIYEAVTEGNKWILANHNLHSIYLCNRKEKMRLFFSHVKLSHIDGMSLIFLAKLFGFAVSRSQRVTYVDWIGPLMAEAEKNKWRVFFLGGRPGIGEAAAKILKHKFSGIELAVHNGFFDACNGSADNRRIVATINSFRPQILIVGMGMPLQEYWILDHLEKLDVNIILPAGACMDYVAGAVRTPPRWMGRTGLEWLYRFVAEPRRLARRYLIEPWFLSWLLLKELGYRFIRNARNQ